MHIVASALKVAGITVTDLTLCTTSLYKACKMTRFRIDEGIRSAFCPWTGHHLQHICWKTAVGHEGTNSDLTPVVVSDKDIEKLLAIPKLSSLKCAVCCVQLYD